MFYYYDDIVSRGKALIIHSGALGDCLLTLRLAEFLRKQLGLQEIEFFGQMSNIEFLPGRTSISKIKHIDSTGIGSLFVPSDEFNLNANKRLIDSFAGYDWIISFLGEPGSDFEQNLAMTACATSSPELVLLSAKAPDDYERHISQYHLEEFINSKTPSIEAFGVTNPHKYIHQEHEALITPKVDDVRTGYNLFSRFNINAKSSTKLAIICPGSGGEFKCWHLSNFIELAEKLSQKGYTPVFLLGYVEEERFTPEQLDSLSKKAPVARGLTTTEVLTLLTHSDIFIGNDSGITHLSAMCGMPTLAIFGMTNPTHYRPIGARAKETVQPKESFTEFCLESVKNVLEIVLQY